MNMWSPASMAHQVDGVWGVRKVDSGQGPPPDVNQETQAGGQLAGATVQALLQSGTPLSLLQRLVIARAVLTATLEAIERLRANGSVGPPSTVAAAAAAQQAVEPPPPPPWPPDHDPEALLAPLCDAGSVLVLRTIDRDGCQYAALLPEPASTADSTQLGVTSSTAATETGPFGPSSSGSGSVGDGSGSPQTAAANSSSSISSSTSRSSRSVHTPTTE